MQQMTVKDMAHVLNGVEFEDGEAINLEFCNKDSLRHGWRICKDPHWNFDMYLYRLIIKQTFSANFSISVPTKVKNHISLIKESNYNEYTDTHFFIFKLVNDEDHSERLIHFEFEEVRTDQSIAVKYYTYPVIMNINGRVYHLTDSENNDLYYKSEINFTESDYHCIFFFDDKRFDRIVQLRKLN